MHRRFRPAGDSPVAKFEGRLLELFSAIHRDLTTIGGSYEECKGMGATLSLCWFTPEWLHFAHVGDSRIYRMQRGGKLCQLSHDHSHVGWLRRSGRISELEARVHPRRNALRPSARGRPPVPRTPGRNPGVELRRPVPALQRRGRRGPLGPEDRGDPRRGRAPGRPGAGAGDRSSERFRPRQHDGCRHRSPQKPGGQRQIGEGNGVKIAARCIKKT